MKEMAKKNQQLRAGEILIIVVVLFMWAGQFLLSVQARCSLPCVCPPAHQELKSGESVLWVAQHHADLMNQLSNSARLILQAPFFQEALMLRPSALTRTPGAQATIICLIMTSTLVQNRNSLPSSAKVQTHQTPGVPPQCQLLYLH